MMAKPANHSQREKSSAIPILLERASLIGWVAECLSAWTI